jgi:aryl-alcohol dehydrogenase-like predicted oxidoreductase
MQTRRLGRTGLQVSEIGYGAWGIGQSMWLGADDEESLRALHRAIELGVNLIDTALAYGQGHSEKLVGRVVRERSETIHVATKVPPKTSVWPAPPGVPARTTYPADHIVRCAEKSLRFLGTETIDLLQLHTWQDEWLGEPEWQDALSGLKRDGKVRFVGISINDHDPGSAVRAVASGLFDTVQVIYNVFDQSPEAELFPLCRQHDVGVLARVPFDEGSLTGRITPETTFPEGDWRHTYFGGDRKRQVFERVQALERAMAGEAATVAELALRFCLSQDAVSTVIPGMRSVRNVEANAAVSDGRRLSPQMRQALKAHAWPRNFYLAE